MLVRWLLMSRHWSHLPPGYAYIVTRLYVSLHEHNSDIDVILRDISGTPTDKCPGWLINLTKSGADTKPTDFQFKKKMDSLQLTWKLMTDPHSWKESSPSVTSVSLHLIVPVVSLPLYYLHSSSISLNRPKCMSNMDELQLCSRWWRTSETWPKGNNLCILRGNLDLITVVTIYEGAIK